MTAQTLRDAAALMRSRAEAVTAGAEWTSGNYWVTDYDPSDPTGQTAMQRLIGGMDEPDSSHYSSWHPAVALAVADWLEVVATRHDDVLDTFAPGSASGAVTANESTLGFTEALAVARDYLGGDA